MEVTVTICGDKVVVLATAADMLMMAVVVTELVYASEAEVTALVPIVTGIVSAVVVVDISEHDGAEVDSVEPVANEGGESGAVTVTTTVEGVAYAVTIIVERSVDNSVSVTGGGVEASWVTVVAAATPDEPPSTGTTEYVAFLRANGALLGGFGKKGRALVMGELARSARRPQDRHFMMCYEDSGQPFILKTHLAESANTTNVSGGSWVMEVMHGILLGKPR